MTGMRVTPEFSRAALVASVGACGRACARVMEEFHQTDFWHQALHNFQYRVVDSDVEVVAPMRVCATIPCENVRTRRCATA